VDLDLEKIIRIYRVAKATNSVLEQKARLEEILYHQKKSMDTIIDIADVASRTAKADLTGEDVRKAAKGALRHGPRTYAYVAKLIRRQRRQPQKR
jgi:Iap family predicted aminopeptidase